ncbi:beta-ketoacyl synthase chain length factor [Arcticibacterium luteifluviistationis]|uniref:3-oxoacyl-ACP synthase n=1 Tax=Arcticibacterium luteifluviistationis TaxID=1784714 RepID=A0A2Z4GDD5_9BACT|nr:beta-ketoacyl synthase chain length factor [Arcticibacterium luteifluviistationis]AWV99164.1 3-oxoacyl-ACP synthase [Arcticibacterium luteifluviistationis]
MEVFINGIGAISPQDSLDGLNMEALPVLVNSSEVKSIEPVYKNYINPGKARRMSRMVKMGVTAALKALQESEVAMPDAIITGTAMGCLDDTEKFLNAIIDNDEQLLTPTAFIQSTHNTLGAQIALLLACHNYNFTYVQRAFSFENALLDGLMKLSEGDAQNVLIGGHDDMTSGFYTLYDRLGYWKKEVGEDLLMSKSKGAYSGEGAAFFTLASKSSSTSYAKVLGVDMLYKPTNTDEINSWVRAFLDAKNIEPSEIDLVLYGINGDSRFYPTFEEVKEAVFAEQASGYFKHLSGEYATSTSFAMYLTANMLKKQFVPDYVLTSAIRPKSLNRVLILNGSRNENYSLTLLGKC